MKLVGTAFLIVGAATVIVVAVPRILPEREEDRASWPYVIAEPASAATVRETADPDTQVPIPQGLGPDIRPRSPASGLGKEGGRSSQTTPALARLYDTVPRRAPESGHDAVQPASAEAEPASAEVEPASAEVEPVSTEQRGSWACCVDATECCCSSPCRRRPARREGDCRSRCKPRCR
jgi:hypothetical protein